MKRLIDITLYLDIGGKPFPGHTESKNEIHKDVLRHGISPT